MSRLDDLIRELCPNGVEWVNLGNIGENLDNLRKPVTSGNRESGNIPYYGASGIVDYVKDYIFDGDYLLVSEDGANLLARTTPIAFSVSGKIWVNNHAHVLRFETYATRRYIEIYLNSIDLTPYISGAAQPKLNQNNLNNIKIPFPPQPVQEEIVRILDNFTELTVELTVELTARKKQYEYYRDSLLTFDDEVEVKQLGVVAKIQRGASPRPIAKYITEDDNGIPWIKIGDTTPNSKYVNKTEQKVTQEGADKSRVLKKGDFIMSNSMSFGRPYILSIDGAIHDGWASISEFSGSLNSDFLYHYLSSNFVQNYWVSKINSGSVSNLNSDIIKSLPIPLPSLAEQQRIVDILDRFDTLCNDITSGLPAEIKSRQQQYAYYRDKLLTFKELETAD